jgi:hypothetical protein
LEELFWRNIFGGIFWEKIFGRIFWEEFFGRNYLVEINKESMFLSRFWGNFVSMQGRRKEGRILILRTARQAHRS